MRHRRPTRRPSTCTRASQTTTATPSCCTWSCWSSAGPRTRPPPSAARTTAPPPPSPPSSRTASAAASAAPASSPAAGRPGCWRVPQWSMPLRSCGRCWQPPIWHFQRCRRAKMLWQRPRKGRRGTGRGRGWGRMTGASTCCRRPRRSCCAAVAAGSSRRLERCRPCHPQRGRCFRLQGSGGLCCATFPVARGSLALVRGS
mmetsp:Transcript_44774/g.93777  ORF Transcript_44774/g.93777 Transcript_44774/m.93777 type:complete len:201 (+) Transcript_44774:143-745(+)